MYQGAQRRVGVHHHLVLGPRIVLPAVHRLQIHRAELPLPHRVFETGPEPVELFVVGHREPVFAQQYTVFDEHLLEDRCLAEEQRMLGGGAEPHHLLHAGAVVPGPVEQHDLPLGGQVGDVALVVPLAPLAVRGRGQRGDPGDARTQVLGDPHDRATLACGVTAFEDDHDAGTGVADPFLQLHQFRLQKEQFGLVYVPRDLLDLRAGPLLAHLPILDACGFPARVTERLR